MSLKHSRPHSFRYGITSAHTDFVRPFSMPFRRRFLSTVAWRRPIYQRYTRLAFPRSAYRLKTARITERINTFLPGGLAFPAGAGCRAGPGKKPVFCPPNGSTKSGCYVFRHHLRFARLFGGCVFVICIAQHGTAVPSSVQCRKPFQKFRRAYCPKNGVVNWNTAYPHNIEHPARNTAPSPFIEPGVVATELGLELAARGHQVLFISYNQPCTLSTFFNKNVDVSRGDRSIYSRCLILRLYETALTGKICVDVAFVRNLDDAARPLRHSARHLRLPGQADLAAKGKHRRSSTTLHGTNYPGGKERSNVPSVTFAIENSDCGDGRFSQPCATTR
ncbi:hypothetical protein FQR65_LT20143 [Abscondita terminalis]|nr:hypothetical protein FQR65_LT20143 [Abscondita terminalis]